MDSTELILTEAVSPPTLVKDLSKIEGVSDSEEKKKQAAKDFESVFIDKLLDTMKDTIGDWGFDKDGTSKQVQGIFWLYLARDIANNGGFGLWKDLYQFLTNSGQTNTTAESQEKAPILL
ncbi:MAG: hypothetical protein ACYS0C_00455 [Planctomycetota bacterium]|jgi:flagellar protein FlgJ